MRIANEHLSAEIALEGGELQALAAVDGRSFLWHGDPAWWNFRAPLLFPVIGESPGGTVAIDGQVRPIGKHGFTRTATFEAVEAADTRCVVRLEDSAETRASYPFAFTLDVTYRLEGATLATEAAVTNCSDRPMPACFGFHPAFLWPLPGCDGLDHVVRLEGGREPSYRRLNSQGVVAPALLPSAFTKGEMVLDHDLFAADALLMEHGAGDTAWYGAVGKPGLRLRFVNLSQLAIWSKPGEAPFVCIEPWHGMTYIAGDSPELVARRGASVVSPGERLVCRLDITVET
ncbi:aldose 1-epimerase family protein [Marinivivus vitaminiproducens]|uniref:aldose 1-epimerase family protein n=1 Tax=Marinivivus vitaminiproducens TaxID=3035935 RepID=UPI0027A488DA|nr:aldose 1-epimerase family protein [Geminicoccaceae bacterium SCSIO 64248]